MAKIAYLLLATVVLCLIVQTLSASLDNDGRERHLRKMQARRNRLRRGYRMNRRANFLTNLLDKVPFLKNLIMGILKGMCYGGRYLPFIGPKCETLLGGGGGSAAACPVTNPTPVTKPQTEADIADDTKCSDGSDCFTPCEWSPLIGMPVVMPDHPGLTNGQCAVRLAYCEDLPVAEADYVSCHSLDLKQPLYTSQYHTKARVFEGEGGERDSNTFGPDERITKDQQLHHDDYTGTNMDRGHMVPNADFGTEKARKCTFRVTNIFHQKDYANRGCWRLMEEFLRDFIEDDVFTKIEMHNSLVYTIPGMIDEMHITKAGKKDKMIAYPYYAFKFVLAIHEDKNAAVINICYLHNPDAHAPKKGTKLETPVGLHENNCLKTAKKEHCLSHCVGLDDPRPIKDMTLCVEVDNKLATLTVKDLMDASRLNFWGIVEAAKAKYGTVVTDKAIGDYTGNKDWTP